MNTQENNKLIAEFIGLHDEILSTGNIHSWSDAPFFYITEDSKEKVMEGVAKYSKYHTSWDWLMPVVEKIRNVPSYDRDRFSTEVIIYGNKTTIKSGGYGEKKHSKFFFNKTIRGTNNTTEAAYYAVVEFIKWYNK